MNKPASTSSPLQVHLDHRRERWIGLTLRMGVWMSAALMIGGIVLLFLSPADSADRFTSSSITQAFSRIANGSVFAAKAGNGETLMMAGLIVLMFTPFLRVAVALAGFAAEKDWRFTAVSAFVLAMLILELFLMAD